MTDPKRLIEPESRSSPTLRALLRAGRSELPDDDRIETIDARAVAVAGTALVGATHGGPAAPGTGAVAGATAGLKVGGAAKVCVAVLVALGGAGGGYAWTSHRAIEHSAAAPPARSSDSLAAVLSGTRSPPPAPTSIPADPVPVPEPSQQFANPPAPSAEGAGGTAAEVSLLESAEDALSSSPELALSLADRHAARFPHGALAQEREVIAIEALLRLGRVEAARGRAERFYRSFPQSAHRTRIENLLAADATHNP
jgi:hypothetical protein